MYIEDLEMVKTLRSLSEEDLRKLVRAFFAKHISRNNVQSLHGTGEHGKDAVAVIDKDQLERTQILIIQAKKGDISQSDWRNEIAGQMIEALNTQETQFPRGTSRDNPRRLLLFLSGELKPEAFEAISSWNRSQPIPVEVFNIFDISGLFRSYGVKPSDFGDLLELARTLSL